ncbi:MAG TPA: chemotaxis protein CheW [Vicinamibacterales bacterium]|nr:chemotaxis protein CheW [Vicinamibacterales bacterium]
MSTNQSGDTTKARPYILFSVAGTTYALPSDQVRHMEMVGQITAVPNAAPFIEGVAFSRGQVVPVINLRVRFGFERQVPDLRSRLLIVEVNSRHIGLLADSAREFVPIADDLIHPPSEAIGGLSGSYVSGVATIDERIILILNMSPLVDTTPNIAA